MLQLFIIFFSFVLCTSSLFANDELWGYKKQELAQVAQTAEPEEEEEEQKIYIAPEKEDKPKQEVQNEEVKPDYIAVPVLRESMRIGDVITQDDVIMSDVVAQSLKDTIIMDKEDVVGKQIRRSVPKDKPISSESIGMPLLVKRNQNVEIIFHKGALLLSTNGRALDQGGAGDRIKVMNLESKKVVTGKVTAQGDIDVTL